MARYKFFLSNPTASKESPIYYSISYNGNRAKLKTKQKIKSTAWNKTSNSVRKNWTEYKDTQIELDRIETIVKKGITNLISQFKILPPPSELKKILEADIFGEENSRKNDSFWDYFTHFIEKLPSRKSVKTGKPISKNTVESYQQTFNAMEKFEQQTENVLSFVTLSNKTYDSILVFFESNLKFVPNTIGKHIKNFKSVLNYARDHDGVEITKSYRDKYWKVIKQFKTAEEIVFLNEDELGELWELDLISNKQFEKTRDIFLVGAWTALRISDIVNLTQQHINEARGMIYIRTQKTDKQVAIPIHPIVRKILKKYGGQIPKIAEPTINKNIKLICSQIESLNQEFIAQEYEGNKLVSNNYKRFEKITSHTARRSFASNMYKRNFSKQEIMAITGHKKEVDFLRYIGITNDELAMGMSEKFKELYK